MTTHSQMPVQSGDRAPDFVVPAVHEERTISLADYRGKTPVLLGLFRGLYCPFCRRSMAKMAATADELKSLIGKIQFEFDPTDLRKKDRSGL